MAIQGGPWIFFNEFKRQTWKKNIDVETDTLKMALMASTWVPDIDAQAAFPDISAHQIAGNGYPAGGVALANKVLTRDDVNDRTVFGANSASFGPAAGGSITGRRAVIYDDTTTPKYLVCHCLLDESNQDVTAPEGVSLEVALPNGIGALI